MEDRSVLFSRVRPQPEEVNPRHVFNEAVNIDLEVGYINRRSGAAACLCEPQVPVNLPIFFDGDPGGSIKLQLPVWIWFTQTVSDSASKTTTRSHASNDDTKAVFRRQFVVDMFCTFKSVGKVRLFPR